MTIVAIQLKLCVFKSSGFYVRLGRQGKKEHNEGFSDSK